MIGLVIKSTGKNSLVKAKNKVYKCTLRGNFRLENNFSNPIVSGDLVKIEILFKILFFLEATHNFVSVFPISPKIYII